MMISFMGYTYDDIFLLEDFRTQGILFLSPLFPLLFSLYSQTLFLYFIFGIFFHFTYSMFLLILHKLTTNNPLQHLFQAQPFSIMTTTSPHAQHHHQQKQDGHDINSEQRTVAMPPGKQQEPNDLHTMKEQNVAAVLSPLSSISSPPPTDTMTIEPGHIQPSPLPLPLSSSSLSPSLPQVLELMNSESIPSPPPSAAANEMDIGSPNTGKQISPSPPPYATNMTRDQIRYCGAIIRNLKKHRDATPFIHPVDYVKLDVPDYPQIIKTPMDLTTIDRKLRQKEYNDVNQFISDIRLVFNNCYKYNGPEATVSMLCQNVESAFEKSLRQMPLSKKVATSSTTPPQAISPVFRRRSEANRPTPSKDYSDITATTSQQQKRRRSSDNSIASKRRRKNDTRLKFCGQALRELKKNKYRLLNYPFLYPVDAVALNIPDYHTIITHPMDISTIERKLTNHQYDSAEDFENDIRLMFNNCYRYNPPALPIHKMAKDLETVFDKKWKLLPERESTPPPPTTPLHSSITKAAAYHSTSNSDDDDDDGDGTSGKKDSQRNAALLTHHLSNR
ncbi:unnamed protein product [Absidia cylindrospora]